MYINVGVGNVTNQKPFSLVSYDFDVNGFQYWDYNSSTIKTIDQASTSNYGVRKWPILNQQGTQITDGAIAMFVEPQYMENNQHTEIKDHNKSVIDGLGFGLFNSEQDSIISKVIQYTNRVAGQGYASSESNVEYTEVTPTEEAPENWEDERLYAYFFGSETGTGQQVVYAYRQIAPTYYEWDSMYAYLQNNPGIKLYKNTELSKRIVIGTAEKCVSFNITKGDYSPGSTYMYPFVSTYQRSANVNSPASGSGGMIIAGDDPTSPAYSLWVANNNPFNTGGFGYFTQSSTEQLTPFYTSGRLSTSAPATKAHPVTECTLFQFGQMKYNGKTYTGVWRVTYKSAYYWGYLGTSPSAQYNPGSWSALSDTEVTYNAQMNTYDRIQRFAFYGICLDDIEVAADIKEGDVPKPPTPGPEGGSYAYPTAGHPFWDTESFGTIAPIGATGIHIYYLTAQEFQLFSNWLWTYQNKGYQFLNNLKEALIAHDDDDDEPTANLLGWFELGAGWVGLQTITENNIDVRPAILFCRKMPEFIKHERDVTNQVGIQLGGLINSYVKPAILFNERIVDTVRYEFGSETSATSFQTGTYFDLNPYVTARLFLPYYGDIDLPVDSFLGGSIAVSYCADIVTGKGGVLVITTDHNGEEVTFGPYECDLSLNIPLAMGDANANARIQAILGSVTNVAQSAISGNVAGTAMGAIKGIAETALIPKTPAVINTFSGGSAVITPTQIMLQLTYPQTLDDKDGAHNLDATIKNIGCTSYQNGKVNEFLTGELTRFSYVDTTGIDATEAEVRAIDALLKEGVY